MRIAIVGAGKLGTVLAQLALKAGYEVSISGSGDPKKIALTMRVLAPGAKVGYTNDIVPTADIVILAMPLGKYSQLIPATFAGKIVIDAMNYWWEVDGPQDELIPEGISSSELIQNHLAGATVIKALNHLGYHDLLDYAAPSGARDRKANAVAGDDRNAIRTVSNVVDQLGFDPVLAGTLADGKRLEPGGPLFGVATDADSLKHLLS